jgi:hypothetical protein
MQESGTVVLQICHLYSSIYQAGTDEHYLVRGIFRQEAGIYFLAVVSDCIRLNFS